MPFALTPEEETLARTIRRLSEERIAPRAAEIDRSDEYPVDIVALFRRHELLGLPVPEELGGSGASVLACCLVLEEIAKVSLSAAWILATDFLGQLPLLLVANEEQRRQFVRPLGSGEKLAAFGLTEPGAGSDAGGLATMAVRQGDHYVLQGTKCFISEADHSALLIVFAKTDPGRGTRGISAFVVERGTPGFAIGKLEEKMGCHGSSSCEVILDDCRIPRQNLLGEEGQGFKIAMQTLDKSRPEVAAQAVGVADGALHYALGYTKERVQFGRPIATFQGLQFMMADMAAQVEAARLLVYRAAHLIDHDGPASEIITIGSMAKLFATDAAMRVTTDAVQLLGGYGYMRDHPLERMMRDAKVMQITEGTNQIQRVIIAGQLLK